MLIYEIDYISRMDKLHVHREWKENIQHRLSYPIRSAREFQDWMVPFKILVCNSQA